MARSVHRAVNGKAGGIDVIFRGHHLAALKINFHERRRGDLLEHPPVWIDEDAPKGNRLISALSPIIGHMERAAGLEHDDTWSFKTKSGVRRLANAGADKLKA